MAYDFCKDWWKKDSLKKAEKPSDGKVRHITYKCTQCGEIKPRDGFFDRETSPFIRQPCKACIAAHKRAKRLELREVRQMSGEELRRVCGR